MHPSFLLRDVRNSKYQSRANIKPPLARHLFAIAAEKLACRIDPGQDPEFCFVLPYIWTHTVEITPAERFRPVMARLMRVCNNSVPKHPIPAIVSRANCPTSSQLLRVSRYRKEFPKRF